MYDLGFIKEDSVGVFCQNAENVTKVILTLTDGTTIDSTELAKYEGEIVAAFNGFPLMEMYYEEGVIMLTCSVYKEIKSFTVEETANKDIVRTTIEIDMNSELPYKHLSE